jgi:hypothetical protein
MCLLSHINSPYGIFFPSTTLVSSPLKTQFVLYAPHLFTHEYPYPGDRSPERINFLLRCLTFACLRDASSFHLHAPKSLSWDLDFRNTVPCILSADCLIAQNLPSPVVSLSADCRCIFRPSDVDSFECIG